MAGILLGGAGVLALRDHRPDGVALVALPAMTSGGSSDVDGIFHVDGQLAVVNVGAAPVTVRLVSGTGAGLMTRDANPEPEIGPGGTGWIQVKIRVVCAVGLGTEEVSLRLSASAEGGEPQEADYPVAFLDSAWGGAARSGCERMTP